MELNLRVIIDKSKASVCFGPTLVCRFNRYWIKTSGSIRVNTWILKYCTDKHTNFKSPFAKLTTLCGSSRIPTPKLHKASCQLSIKGHPIISGFFFFNYITWFYQKKQLGHQYQYRFMYITEKACYISRFLAFEVMIFKTITVCSIIYTASSSGTTICKVNWSHRKNVGQKNNFLFLQWRKINSDALTLLASRSVAGTCSPLKTETQTYIECYFLWYETLSH